jgi:type II secretory pathway pseudopilin PulG
MKTSRAFSLIETSIVILIIGVVVAGVVQGARLMKKAKLTSARAATAAAPVNFIKDLSIWYDTSSEESFPATQAESGKAVSSWNSIIKTGADVAAMTGTAASGSEPTYVAGSLSSLPTLSFGGTKAMNLPDGSFPNGNSAYTVFLVAEPSSGGTVLSSGSGNNINSIGFDAGGNFTVNGGSGNGGSFLASTTGNNLQIITHSYDGTTPDATHNKVWVNGVSSTINSISNAGSAKATNADSVKIGATSGGLNGNLGEVIVFARALDDEERQEVEKYLTKKWNVKFGKASLSSAAVCNVSGSGISSGSTVTQGASTMSCNDSSYHGTATLSATCATNGSNLTASGCVANSAITCNVTFTGGISGSATTVNYGASTVACPSGYSGTATLSDTCTTNGQALTASSGCTQVYAGCSAASNPANGTVGSYSASPSSGTYASGTTATVTCNSGYLASSSSNAANITCTNGSWSSATCSQACATASVTNGTVGSYSNSAVSGYYASATTATLTCDSGYTLTGSSSGTCNNGSWGLGSCNATVASCTGGDTTYNDSSGGYRVHKFTSSSTSNFNCPTARNISVLVVAGGGGATGDNAYDPGGGGGGGGVVVVNSYAVTANTDYQITVGNGGSSSGTPASDSSFASFVAKGGGFGSSRYNGIYDGRNGGSGGGQPMNNGAAGTPNQPSYSGATSYGNSGGTYSGGCGGGGGAGAAGGNGSGVTAGNGGIGISNSFSGTATYYGGGGGGTSSDGNPSGTGGLGGGGTYGSGASGASNTGGGAAAGGNGGSGIVIIRYAY